jgi:hypothetical protein
MVNSTLYFDLVLETSNMLEFGLVPAADALLANVTNSSASSGHHHSLSSSPSPDDDATLASLTRHQYVLLGWVSLVVSVVGIAGNAFVIRVLLQPSMRAHSTNVFLAGLAVADLLALCTLLLLVPLRYLLVSHGSLLYYELHTLTFPYLYPLCATFQFCSIYMTVGACVNRSAIVHGGAVEGHHHASSSSEAALRVVAAIFALSFLVCLPFWFEYHTDVVVVEAEEGDHHHHQHRVYLNVTELAQRWHYRFLVHVCLTTVVTYAVPLALLTVMNAFLVLALVRTRRRKLELGLRERNELYITFMLVTIVLLFIACQMPNLLVHLLYAFGDHAKRSAIAFSYWHQWANFLLIVNTSSNFAVYCFFGANFRDAVCEMWTRVRCMGRSRREQEHIEIQPVVVRQQRIRKLSRNFSRISRLDRLSQSFNGSKSYQTLNNMN